MIVGAGVEAAVGDGVGVDVDGVLVGVGMDVGAGVVSGWVQAARSNRLATSTTGQCESIRIALIIVRSDIAVTAL